jgi:hypothetical protein
MCFMRRRTNVPDWVPSVRRSPEVVRHARALAQHLSEGGELSVVPGLDVGPGEIGHACWPSGSYAAVFAPYQGTPYVPPVQGWFVADPRRHGLMAAAGTLLGHTPRTGPRGRYWQLLAGGQPVSLTITSQRLILGTGDSVWITPEVSIRSEREGQVLLIEAGPDTVCVWGEAAPSAAVVLNHLAAARGRSKLPAERELPA